MDRWSLYDLDLDLDLDLHCPENYVFWHDFSYICCRYLEYISYCRLWIDGYCMTLTLNFKVMKIMLLGITLVIYVVEIIDIFLE